MLDLDEKLVSGKHSSLAYHKKFYNIDYQLINEIDHNVILSVAHHSATYITFKY